MAAKWQGEPKRWRVRGKSDDGLMVTLGCHDTKKAAQTEAEEFTKEGFYRDVTVERIEPAPGPPQEDAENSAGAERPEESERQGETRRRSSSASAKPTGGPAKRKGPRKSR
jgi:hypothetical protein